MLARQGYPSLAHVAKRFHADNWGNQLRAAVHDGWRSKVEMKQMFAMNSVNVKQVEYDEDMLTLSAWLPAIAAVWEERGAPPPPQIN